MISVAARRVAATTAAPTLVRAYTSSVKEGSVAQSKDFGKKGMADEKQYVQQHEAEQLRKLKAQIQQKKTELRADERLQAELESKVKGTESK